MLFKKSEISPRDVFMRIFMRSIIKSTSEVAPCQASINPFVPSVPITEGTERVHWEQMG